MSGWFAADAFLFVAWFIAYQAVMPLRMTDPPASGGGKMLLRLLLLAASGLLVVLTTYRLVKRWRDRRVG